MQVSATTRQHNPCASRPNRRVATRAVAQDRTATLRQLLAKPGILLVRGGPLYRVCNNRRRLPSPAAR
jgi:hypothetical protein